MKSLFALLFFVSTIPALACEDTVLKTQLPLNGKIYHDGLCLPDYWAARDLGRISEGEDHRNPEKIVYFRDKVGMRFSEMFLITAGETALGVDGRRTLVRKLQAAWLASLRNDTGACTLEIRDGDRLLGLPDFLESSRSANDQPGTRLSLTKDDLKRPAWKLICPGVDGVPKVEKSGNYLFVFFDLYERVDPNLKGHLVSYLASFQ